MTMMIPRWRAAWIAGFAAWAALTGAAAAQAQTDDARARELAYEVVETSGALAAIDASLDLLVASVLDLVRSDLGDLSDDELSRLARYYAEEMRLRTPELRDSLAEVYINAFTAAELADLVAFYATPTGRRLAEISPQLTHQFQVVGAEWGERIGPVVAAAAFARLQADEDK